MVDQLKRSTLKTISAAATVAAVPTTLALAATSATQHSDISAVVDHVQTHMSELGLNVSVIPIEGKRAMAIKFANVCDKPVHLRHISPGLVRSGGQMYDINSALDGRSTTIDPGRSFTSVITPIENETDALVHRHDSKISSFVATVNSANGPVQGNVLTPRLVLS